MHFKMRKEGMLIIGMFSLSVAILLERFVGQCVLTDFFEGLFTGISLAMNLCFLVLYGKERRMNDKKSQN